MTQEPLLSQSRASASRRWFAGSEVRRFTGCPLNGALVRCINEFGLKYAERAGTDPKLRARGAVNEGPYEPSARKRAAQMPGTLKIRLRDQLLDLPSLNSSPADVTYPRSAHRLFDRFRKRPNTCDRWSSFPLCRNHTSTGLVCDKPRHHAPSFRYG